MIIDLTDTTASKISAALVQARARAGGSAMGAVLTLVVATEEKDHYDAMKAASTAAREHPARILIVVHRPESASARLDAEIRVGDDTGPGETVLLRIYGELSAHADSVILPLLLPDTPVVVWWPSAGPDVPAKDALGLFATRRVTDAAASVKPLNKLKQLAAGYTPGDTDMSWTRLTPWRSLLASSLDQHTTLVSAATVSAEANNPSAELLALWLTERLNIPVTRKSDAGPGITSVELTTQDGGIKVDRPDGLLAVLSMPGQPDRPVALKRRELADLVAEELRRLDPDDIYAAVINRVGNPDPTPVAGPAPQPEVAPEDQGPVTSETAAEPAGSDGSAG